MLVELRQARRLAPGRFRLTLDVVDLERTSWEPGDCVIQVDLEHRPHQLVILPRGILEPASELFRLSPTEPPVSTESRLLWDMARAVDQYAKRLFNAGVLCPCECETPGASPERSDGGSADGS